jgi:hypothetical protein
MNRTIWLPYVLVSILFTCCTAEEKKNEPERVLKEIPDNVFFSEHVAPILYEHCIKCHKPGGIAPFPLMTYAEVVRKKSTVAGVLEEDYMPPWPADPSYSNFIGQNVLTETEKSIVYTWIKQGAREGNPASLPEMPDLSEKSNLGIPDTTLYMDSILVEGNNRDRFYVVKVPIELEQDTFLRAIEFVPGKHQLVHHLNGHLLTYEEGKKEDVFEGIRRIDVELPLDQYRKAFDSLKMLQDDGSAPKRIHSAVNYLPGVMGMIYPDGVGGFYLNKKATLVANDMHYAPVPQDYWDRSHFNLFYSDKPPARPTRELMLGTNGVSPIVPPLVIQPDTVQTFLTQYTLEKDISILTVNPHMHLLGKKFLAFAVTKLGDTIPLIRINDWDFRWQFFYTYKKMLPIPKGSTIYVYGTFDNTKANENNPFDPPRVISERLDRGGSGMRTTDEMFQFIITYVPYKRGDESISLEFQPHDSSP